jgi:alpha-beta hydrolase superfamily lysophospholipase
MQRTERTELRRLIEHLAARGFHISGIDDGGEERVDLDTWADWSDLLIEVVEAVFAVDSSTLFVQRPGGKEHGIELVLGNADDGSEIVSDYSWTNGDPDKFTEAMVDFDLA